MSFNITSYLITKICTHTTHTLKHTDTPIPHVVLPLRPHHNIHVHVPYAHMSHHLHLILLYSPQHLLPTSSVLHHDDHSDWQYTMKLYWSGKGVKEQNKSNIQIHIITYFLLSLFNTLKGKTLFLLPPPPPRPMSCYHGYIS